MMLVETTLVETTLVETTLEGMTPVGMMPVGTMLGERLVAIPRWIPCRAASITLPAILGSSLWELQTFTIR
jgi:hypothetical protein